MKTHIGLLGILMLMNALWAREYFTVTETNWIAYPEAFEKGIETTERHIRRTSLKERLTKEL